MSDFCSVYFEIEKSLLGLVTILESFGRSALSGVGTFNLVAVFVKSLPMPKSALMFVMITFLCSRSRFETLVLKGRLRA